MRIGDNELLIIGSAGGGNVGAPLLTAVIQAFRQLSVEKECYLKVFTGPFLDDAAFERLIKIAGENVQLDRFTPSFLSYLSAADLSVSMGGYNTTMNLLATGVPALVWLFPQNREQRMRTERLAEAGLLKLLEEEDLQPRHLADLMDRTLTAPRSGSVKFDLDGARNTARWIGNWGKTKKRTSNIEH